MEGDVKLYPDDQASRDDLRLYALSYPVDAPMVRATALQRLELGEVIVEAGQALELEPDAAALLHRDGLVEIVREISRGG